MNRFVSVISEKIQNYKLSGDFGWSDDYNTIKGIVFQLKGISLLACAGGNYVTIAKKEDGDEEWTYVCSHDSCWRDGVRTSLRNASEKLSPTLLEVWVDIGNNEILSVTSREPPLKRTTEKLTVTIAL